MDQITLQRIEKLHPSVRQEVKKIIEECNKVLTAHSEVRITQGLRTNEEQAALYLKRPKVTNAKAGQSIHNYGFAVDIVLLIDGKVVSYDMEKDYDKDGAADWNEVVKVFVANNWNWGGNWKTFKDFPHFEKFGFNNWKTLSKKKKDGNGYVIL